MASQLTTGPEDEFDRDPDNGFNNELEPDEADNEILIAGGNPAGAANPPLSLANLAGQQVGRYRIERQIGSGGVAVVYQAYDGVQGMPVALKVLMPHADPKTYSRFRREALTAGGLRHEHIVRVLQVGTLGPGGLAYIAMELVEGESLSNLLNLRGLLHPQESCNLLEPIARALDHAHRAGIVHRDVKPSNILLRTVSPGAANSVQLETLDHPVVPLLSDFGVARYLDAPELTNTGRTVGTPAYMAPEQCAGKRDVDGRADIYALGCVLYRCVTGRLPFAGSVTQILHAHVYEPLTIDNDTLLRLPPVLVEILRRSLAKQPQDRYATAGEMAQALAFAAGRSPARHPAAPSEATATLTLASPPTPATPTPATSSTVIIPGTTTTPPPPPPARPGSNPFTTRNTRPVQPATAASSQRQSSAREESFYRFTWALLPIALAVLVFAFVVALIGSPFGLGRGDDDDGTPVGVVILPTPTHTLGAGVATFTPSPGATPGEGQNPPPGSTPATATGVPPTAVVPLPTDTATLTTVPPTDEPPSPTWTATPLPTDTPTLTPSATPTPTLTATLTPTLTATPSPTATWTPEATATPTVANTETPTPPPGGCTTSPDPIWSSYITSLDPTTQQGFVCAITPATPANAELQTFEQGFMLWVDNQPNQVYVLYTGDGSWEAVSASWQPGDPETPAGPQPGPEFFLPVRIFGRVWEDERIRTALGFATESQPQSFPARVQSFPGGLLVINLADGRVLPFFTDRQR